MRNKSKIYIKTPIILICLALCISGIRWMISPEPWLLDQVANEERLEMSFMELFQIDGNSTLGLYLTQIYRFLGLYVLGIGVTFLSFTQDKFFQIAAFRKRLLCVLGLLLFANLILALTWIPSSHFIFIMLGAIGLFLISFYKNLKES